MTAELKTKPHITTTSTAADDGMTHGSPQNKAICLTAHIFTSGSNLHNVWRTSAPCCSEHVCWLHFHQPFIQNSASKAALLSLLSSFATSVQTLCKIDCASIILSFKICSTCPSFCCKTRSRLGSLSTDACETFRHASLHYQVLTSTCLLLFKQTVDGLYLPVFRYTATVDFIQKPGRNRSTQHLMLKVQ